jgi:hypothetical protein
MGLRLLRGEARHLLGDRFAVRERRSIFVVIAFGVGLADVPGVEADVHLTGFEMGAESLGGFADVGGPAGFLEQLVRIGLTGDGVDHGRVGKAEIAGDVTAHLLPLNDLKGADLEVGADEVLIEVLRHARIGQGVPTERVGVVSGKLLVFEVARQVDHEDHLLLGAGTLKRLGRLAHEANVGADASAFDEFVFA